MYRLSDEARCCVNVGRRATVRPSDRCHLGVLVHFIPTGSICTPAASDIIPGTVSLRAPSDPSLEINRSMFTRAPPEVRGRRCPGPAQLITAGEADACGRGRTSNLVNPTHALYSFDRGSRLDRSPRSLETLANNNAY
ncbi:unnamed protein product [Arctogadus glacialis]